MTAIPSPEIWHRGDFGLLCEWRLLYRAVEIGVDRGTFAECFLSRSHNCQLYLGIDPYLSYHEMPWDRQGDYLSAVERFSRHANVAKLIRGTSAEVAQSIHQISEAKQYSDAYDFVYIDASHLKEDVADDIRTWWPLVSDKGIIAGHDWDTENGDHSGVQEAVMEFADANGLTVYFTPDSPASWYIYKSGMPGQDWIRFKG